MSDLALHKVNKLKRQRDINSTIIIKISRLAISFITSKKVRVRRKLLVFFLQTIEFIHTMKTFSKRTILTFLGNFAKMRAINRRFPTGVSLFTATIKASQVPFSQKLWRGENDAPLSHLAPSSPSFDKTCRIPKLLSLPAVLAMNWTIDDNFTMVRSGSKPRYRGTKLYCDATQETSFHH